MKYRDHLITLIEVYAAARSLSPSSVTTAVMNSGSAYNLLKEGKDITVGRLERAVAWFDANWPDGTDWPAHIFRPSRDGAGTESKEVA